MAKDKKDDLQRLENHLMADGDGTGSFARVYNADRTDVDLDRFAEEVCKEPRKHSCLAVVILLLLAALGIFLFLVWGGRLPWN